MTSHLYYLPVNCMLDVSSVTARLQDIGYSLNEDISEFNGTLILVDTKRGFYYILNEPEYAVYDDLADIPRFTPTY